MVEKNLREIRIEKLEALKKIKIVPYPNVYKITHKTKEILDDFDKLEKTNTKIKTAGRIMLSRMHGKAGFCHIKDDTGMIQIYIRQDFIGEEMLKIFKLFDIGDFIGVEGEVFKTHTNEITIKVDKFTLLAKSLLPLPEKWHGLSNIEARYRQRYLDLIMNDKVKENFIIRSKAIRMIRDFLHEEGFIEVETPMMQPIYGGAFARPFITHHNTLDIDLYMRIAIELYLKRLIVGGFEKVFEMNRVFRNEGISTQHNPEYTLLELYQAYADYNDMMKLNENLICSLVKGIKGSLEIEYQGNKLDFKPPWRRLTYLEALEKYTGKDFKKVKDKKQATKIAETLEIDINTNMTRWEIIAEIFDEKVEPNLIQPTFILDYPLELSPLAKSKPNNTELVERFESFIAGMEIGNAFSELNDPIEQKRRFDAQVEKRKQGHDEAHPMDMDFITSLEYGMPLTGGLGIGIDRIIMLLLNTHSIRDTILFPLLKPKKKEK